MSATELAVPVAALRACREVTRRRARNFYYGLRLLPEPKRSALYAIYAWMRRADDLTDDPTLEETGRRERLERFRLQTVAAIHGDPPCAAAALGDPVWEALAFAAQRFGLREEAFHEMLDGQLEDLDHRRYETFDELRAYCYRVASTVGLVCIEVWGYDDQQAPGLAVDRGIAFQLTNILRDLAQDIDAGRIYLPMEDFRRHRLQPNELRRWSRPADCEAFLAEQFDRAVKHYERSRGLEMMISPDCRSTLWAMTAIYRQLLEKARRHPGQLMQGPRLRLTSWAKAGIALKAKWMAERGSVPA